MKDHEQRRLRLVAPGRLSPQVGQPGVARRCYRHAVHWMEANRDTLDRDPKRRDDLLRQSADVARSLGLEEPAAPLEKLKPPASEAPGTARPAVIR
jgi:hypothetical protein